ncbi:unnamed protein product [Ixodes hexagonus]
MLTGEIISAVPFRLQHKQMQMAVAFLRLVSFSVVSSIHMTLRPLCSVVTFLPPRKRPRRRVSEL